jgi:hypothetical protein
MIAHLWYKHSHGEGLAEDEIEEMKHALDANMRKAQRLADLENLSLMASIINDTDWHLKICKDIDDIMSEMYEYK